MRTCFFQLAVNKFHEFLVGAIGSCELKVEFLYNWFRSRYLCGATLFPPVAVSTPVGVGAFLNKRATTIMFEKNREIQHVGFSLTYGSLRTLGMCKGPSKDVRTKGEGVGPMRTGGSHADVRENNNY